MSPNTLIKMLLDPAALVFAILGLAWLLSFTPWRAGVRRLLLICLLIFGLVYFGPLPALVSQPLANRFPPADYSTLPPPELIVVLGGMTRAEPVQEPGSAHPPFTRRSERFLMGLELASTFPDARLVFTGWAGPDAGVNGAEATRLAALAIFLGIDQDRILIDPLAQTTADHPHELADNPAIGPRPAAETYLVTSATHMPRAMGVFRQAGWENVHAVPTDYPFPPTTPWYATTNPIGKKLTIVQEGLSEWVGLITYYWRGQISVLFPGPNR